MRQQSPEPLSVTFVGTATTLLHLGPFTLLTDPNFLHAGQRAYLGYGLAGGTAVPRHRRHARAPGRHTFGGRLRGYLERDKSPHRPTPTSDPDAEVGLQHQLVLSEVVGVVHDDTI